MPTSEHEKREEKLLASISTLLSREEGRELCDAILEHTKPFSVDFDPDNERNDAFRRGQQSVGMWLWLKMLEADPARCGRMIQTNGEKAVDARRERQRERERRAGNSNYGD